VLDPEDFEEVVKEIIREFDCDFDDELGYQEFLNIFLPSTDQDLRKKCMNNISGQEPTTQVRLLATDILSLESSLAFQKLFYRNNLSRYKYTEFEPQRAFDKMCSYSEREGKVDMVAMKSFLETCKVPARGTLAFMDDLRDSGEPLAFNRIDAGGPLSKQEKLVHLQVKGYHLEAIRRRCDHDQDRMLSFDEFLEVVRGVQVPDAARPPSSSGSISQARSKSISRPGSNLISNVKMSKMSKISKKSQRIPEQNSQSMRSLAQKNSNHRFDTIN